MPELPEVETIRRQLEPRLVGATITDSWTFGTPKFSDAPLALGSSINSVRRLGKYLLMGLTSATGGEAGAEPVEEGSEASGPTERELIVHLGMTGRLAVIDSSAGGPTGFSHIRASWELTGDRTLVFDDVRRFGRIAVVEFGDYRSLPTLFALGPEPFGDSFTPESLREAINGSRRAIKTQLLSQRVVAGVGNIYADEALWLAGVHPRSQRLTWAQAVLLRDEIRNVLRSGIDDGGTTLRNYRDADGGSGSHQERLLCYGRAGQDCRRCGSILRRIVVDARSTTYCPVCQRR
ncbi:MAG: bifunctional DNA-formamidopyrimidine glycosylase/DNA-(apurinic or apyrimidinic site) lyase [Microthrixaceae bacterium]